MAWCIKCGGEYVDDITTCNKCGVELVEELNEKPKESKKTAPKASRLDNEVFLVNVNSVVELTYIVSMLDKLNISYRVLEKDIGQYLSIRHGRSFFGKSIYVIESQIEPALEAVKSYKAQFDKQGELKSSINTLKNKKHAIFAGIILAIIIIGLVFFGVVAG